MDNEIILYRHLDVASTVPATDADILNMIKETNGDSYEAVRSLDQLREARTSPTQVTIFTV